MEGLSDLARKWRFKIAPGKQSIGRPIEDIENGLDDDNAEKPPAKDPTFGVDAVVKTLYEGKNSYGGCYDWVDYPPKQLSEKAVRTQNRPAIKVYKVKDEDKPVIGGHYSLKYHEISIQNPSLVAALVPILKKQDVHLDPADVADFQPPFRALYFSYDEIFDLYKTTSDAALKGYLALLVRTLDDVFGETRAKKRRLQASGLIDFKLAWTYFSTDDTLYSCGCNPEMLCKVKDTFYECSPSGTFLNISCQMLTFNGEAFVWADIVFKIPKFSGNMVITELPHYPLQFHPKKDEVTQRMLSRGKRVLDLQGLTYSTYSGIAMDDKTRHNVEGRVLIDVLGYNRHHIVKGKEKKQNEDDDNDDAAEEGPTVVDIENKGRTMHLSKSSQMKNKTEMLEKRQDELMFTSPFIEGFALKNKLWLNFFVEDIEPVIWNDEAYDHLVYDEQQKDLVLSFVENHKVAGGKVMEDVIVGKGQGLIILLSGPPGTGKTLTAEAVADRTRRPLFYLQAEDLGTDPSTLGSNIKKVFEMATEWNAVILLDEADVFMAERNPNDLTRNELVSIFLRELEYFCGIIFLTTNLYNTVDHAFRSRVSLHLRFKPLTVDARELIWRKFLNRLPSQKAATNAAAGKKGLLSDSEIKDLSRWDLNGREIKNAIKMVDIWCNQKKYTMSLSRLESGIQVTSPHATKESG